MARNNYTSGLALYKAQVARLAQLKDDREKGFLDMANKIVKDCEELTSGTLTPAQTRGRYARGASRPQRTNAGLKRFGGAPLLPINIVSRRLNTSFRLRGNFKGSKRIDIVSTAGHARFILAWDGTRFMVARGFREEIRKRQAAYAKAYFDTYSKQQRAA